MVRQIKWLLYKKTGDQTELELSYIKTFPRSDCFLSVLNQVYKKYKEEKNLCVERTVLVTVWKNTPETGTLDYCRGAGERGGQGFNCLQLQNEDLSLYPRTHVQSDMEACIVIPTFLWADERGRKASHLRNCFFF